MQWSIFFIETSLLYYLLHEQNTCQDSFIKLFYNLSFKTMQTLSLHMNEVYSKFYSEFRFFKSSHKKKKRYSSFNDPLSLAYRKKPKELKRNNMASIVKIWNVFVLHEVSPVPLCIGLIICKTDLIIRIRTSRAHFEDSMRKHYKFLTYYHAL